MTTTKTRQKPKGKLVKLHHEHVNREGAKFKDILNSDEKGTGIYALYNMEGLYYVGISLYSLKARLKKHTRNKHKKNWTNFSYWLIPNKRYIKEIERLFLRIVKPRGNNNSGKFPSTYNLALRDKPKKRKKRMVSSITTTLLLLSLISTNLLSQNSAMKYSGYLCRGINDNIPFRYTREYKKDGDNFVTIYKIYSLTAGYIQKITCTHYKSEKKVSISIDDITVSGGMGHLDTEEETYESLNLKPFGRRGAVQEMFDAQSRLPNDLEVKFVSIKYDYIKVMNVTRGFNTYSGQTEWYVLDK